MVREFFFERRFQRIRHQLVHVTPTSTSKKANANEECKTSGKGLDLGSNSREDMDVCKCIVTSWQGGTLIAASPLVRFVEGEERWEAPDNPEVFSLKIGVETSEIVLSPVSCSKLRLTKIVT
ncbi:hypothetical protein TNCV_1669411 [Trichonephila clavipes]|nr:hypothetical protein TNCV_1669411 [Trichonephila clavipes]